MTSNPDTKIRSKETRRQPSRIRALIFDFDGTLAKLTIDFDLMRKKLGALALDYSPSPPDPLTHTILEWQTLFTTQLNNGTTRGKEAADSFSTRSQDLIRQVEIEAAKQQGMLFSFTRPMLRSLRESGTKLAIITRNCPQAVRCVFPDYESFCPTLLTRDDVAQVKPAPEHLFAALKRIDCPPREALMIGDHPLDILTGKRAGAWTAGVASGRISQTELLQSGADIIAADCDKLTQKLRARKIIQ